MLLCYNEKGAMLQNKIYVRFDYEKDFVIGVGFVHAPYGMSDVLLLCEGEGKGR